MANILCYVPAYGGQITLATFMATHRMVPMLHQKGHSVAITTSSSPDIVEVRNAMLTAWYDGMKGSSHLLMIDADMGFPPEVVVDMLALNEPMVGVIYPKKSLDIEWAASGWGKDPNAGGKGHFMKVRGLGMGCFLIRRDAVDQIIEQFPGIIDTALMDPSIHPEGRMIRAFEKCRNDEGHLMSEDISFCWRWEKCGGTVWGAGGYEIEHVGPHSFKACYAKWAEEKAAVEKLQQAAE
jgi:hypothetical protein